MNCRVFTACGLASLMGLCLGLSCVRTIAQSNTVDGATSQQAALQSQSAMHDAPKNRLIVLTDIGAEADDTESTVRLLLYSDVIDIQGLIATTSIWRPSPEPELIREVICAYNKVHANLVKHDPAFPPADTLQLLVKGRWPVIGTSRSQRSLCAVLRGC